MSDTYSEEEMLSLENDFEVQMQNVDDLNRKSMRVARDSVVDRLTMESVHKDYPDVADENFPLASYTKDPSDQNLGASLESFDMAKKVAIAAAGGVLGGIIYMLIKLFRSDGAEARAQRVKDSANDIKESDEVISKMIKEARDAKLSAADQKLLKAIEANNYREYMPNLQLDKAPTQGKIFLDTVSDKGDVFRTLEKWSRSIHNHYTSFTARVAALTEHIGEMYDVEAKDTDRFIKKLEDVMLPPDDPFFEDINEMNEIILGFMRSAGGEYRGFLNTMVLNTREFYEMALDSDDWVDRVDKISPNGTKQLEKNLDRLEKEAQALVDGKREATLNAKKAKRKPKIDDNGNIHLDAITSNLNVERAVKEAELAIKSEVKHLQVYRKTLSRVLFFYGEASNKVLELNNERKKLLREMLNRVPAG